MFPCGGVICGVGVEMKPSRVDGTEVLFPLSEIGGIWCDGMGSTAWVIFAPETSSVSSTAGVTGGERGWIRGSGWRRSRLMELFGERMIQGDFRPGGFTEYMVKDLGMTINYVAGEKDDGEIAVLPGAARAALVMHVCDE
ncbi:hypothetical protein Droror1_Dr00024511 [Drosera rotundifolia]